MRPDTVMLYFAPLRTAREKFCESLSAFVSKERRVAPLKEEAHKLSVYSEVLLREAVCSELGISNRGLKFQRTQFGKSYLDCPLKFSLSHTQTAVIVALSFEEVGADIEKLRPARLKVAQRFFSEDEKEFLACSENRDRDFFELWTKKEAYLKQIGRGLTIPLSSFSVLKERERFRTYVRDGYVISLCCKKEDRVYFIEVDENDLEHPHLVPVE